MKKFLTLLLAMIMLFSMSMLVACGGETADVELELVRCYKAA